MKVILTIEETKQLARSALSSHLAIAIDHIEITDLTPPGKSWPTLSNWSWYVIAKANKIIAIKLYRELSRDYIGLAEAKKWVEENMEREATRERQNEAF